MKIEDAPAKHLSDSYMEYLDYHQQQAGGDELFAGWRQRQGLLEYLDHHQQQAGGGKHPAWLQINSYPLKQLHHAGQNEGRKSQEEEIWTEERGGCSIRVPQLLRHKVPGSPPATSRLKQASCWMEVAARMAPRNDDEARMNDSQHLPQSLR